jgi:acyl carrier protein
LGLAPAEPIDPARPLNALGLDSLMAVDLRNALGTRVGRTLPATLLFNYPTVGDLIEFLSSEVLGEGDAPADQHTTVAPPPVAETPADDLEDMSEDELATLLAGKLTGS